MKLTLASAIAGAAMAVLLLWAARRDEREPARLVPVPDPDDDVQGADPFTIERVRIRTSEASAGWPTVVSATGHTHWSPVRSDNVESVPMDDWPELPPYTATRPIGGT